MVNATLLSYVKQQFAAGYDANAIREALVSYGYPINDIDDAIEAATKPAEKPVQPKKIEEIVKEHGGEKTEKEVLPVLPLFAMWFLSLSMPRSVFNEAKGHSSFAGAFMNVSAAAVLGGLIGGAIILAKYFLKMSASYAGTNMFGIGGLFTKMGAIERLFMTPVEAILVWISITAFLYIFGALLGGDGNFETFAYYTSIAYAPVILFVGFLQILVPPCIVFFSYIAFGLLGIYPTIIALQEAHKLDTVKSIIALAIPLAIVMVFMLPVILQFKALLDSVCLVVKIAPIGV